MEKRKLTAADFEFVSDLMDDFDGAIDSGKFKKSDQFDNIALELVIKGPETDDDGEKQFYSVGATKTWEHDEVSVTKIKNPDCIAFNPGSRIATLVERMILAVGNGKREKGIKELMKREYPMTAVDFFYGLNFHWKREVLAKGSGPAGWAESEEGQEAAKKEKVGTLLPTKFLGYVDVEGGSAVTPAADAAAVDTGGTADSGKMSDDDLDAEVIAIASGKTPEELKSEVIALPVMKLNPKYRIAFVKGKVAERLIKEELLSLGADGKYE